MRKFTVKPRGITVHHSLTKDGKTVDAAGIRYYHMHPAHNGNTISDAEYARLKTLGTKGLKPPWDEGGYHRLYERINGVITKFDMRPMIYEGAHCPELNATHLGVCIVGNFDLAPPDKELLDFVAADIVNLMAEKGIKRTALNYHSEFSTKSCPGNKFPKAGFKLAVAGEVRP